MNRQWTPAIIPVFVAAVRSSTAALYVYLKRGHIPRARVGILLMLSGALWMFSSAMETVSTGLQAKVFWYKMHYVGMCIVPMAWMLYAVRYTSSIPWLSLRRRILLSVVPAVTFMLVLTIDRHHLIWTDVWLDSTGAPAVKQITCGDEDRIALTVSDNGVGMPPDRDWSSAETLVMMLVHSLVDQLDGEIELERNNGVRASFKVTFSPLQTTGHTS